ncbi:MAG: respiratory nitrate reductase subunit gamma [Candidatus Alcyoniella australis]|nr:respiratory nitrate reductase subunit gamma [Candidatus Alcyoniella australis]
MIDKLFYFVTVPMVYLAVAWAIVGIIIRAVQIWRRPRHPFTLKVFEQRSTLLGRMPLIGAIVDVFTMPTVRKHQPLFWVFLGLFHLALLALLVAHLDLLPQINIMPTGSKHMLGYGGVGVVLTVSVLYFMWRRFRSPVREISVPADYLLLLLLFLIFITGDTISWANSWNSGGFVIGKPEFAAYLDGLVKFTFDNPRDVLYGSHYVVVVLHVLLANLLLLLLPFSKVMHFFFALPMNKLRRG